MTDWIEIEKGGLPNFMKSGFHTGKLVEVRRDDGVERVTIYQGYGLFGRTSEEMREVITHWRPHD